MFGHQEKYFCSANIINTGTEAIRNGGYVEFVSVGKAKHFKCKIDGEDIHTTENGLCKFE